MIVTKLDEGERQITLLALAELALSRPGFDEMLKAIAIKLNDVEGATFEELKRCNADRVKETHKSMIPNVHNSGKGFTAIDEMFQDG